MSHQRIAFLAITMLALTAGLLADEKPAAKPPLEVLEDCIQAAESGDFERYVDHLTPDEQTLQAGYFLFMTRTTSRANETGLSIIDPELSLLTRTMHDLVQQHLVPLDARGAAYQAAESLLAKLTGESGTPNYQGQPTTYLYPANSEQRKSIVGVLKDPRDFLIAALGEITSPTIVEGEGDSKSNSTVNVGEFIKSAKALKWTVYTRGDYAVAISNQTEQETPISPYAPYHAPHVVTRRQTHVEFKRIDGVWKITRLLPGSAVFAEYRLASRVAAATDGRE